MAEQNNREALPMGEMDTLQMLQRMERLKKLMGTSVPSAPAKISEKREELPLFSRNRQENMISAAIPFLDREYQKDLYIIVRLMEMRRVLSGEVLEARGKQEEPPHVRRRKLLGVVQEYLPEGERQQMQRMLQMMDMKKIMEGTDGK